LTDRIVEWKCGAKNSQVVDGENGKGNNLNQFDHPDYIFVDEDHSVYVSDCSNDRVMKWIKCAKEGMVVACGQCHRNSLTQLSCPAGVIVDG